MRPTPAHRPTIRNICMYFFIGFACCSCTGQKIEKSPPKDRILMAGDLSYFGKVAPKLKPEVFMPGFISMSDRSEFGSVFSKNGKEFYFAIDTDDGARMLNAHVQEGRWTKPDYILPDSKYGMNDPMLSPSEQELYFISDMPLGGIGDSKDHDIWFVQKTSEGWSDPINAGSNINSKANEYYMSFTNAGRMYFGSNRNSPVGMEGDYDLYYSDWNDGVFHDAVKLDENVNSRGYEADVYVAPDDSYLIYCSVRKGGFGRGDLYISFKDDAGQWKKSVNMGEEINDEGHQLCPFVTSDGRYFLFTSHQDIYWVDAELLHRYR